MKELKAKAKVLFAANENLQVLWASSEGAFFSTQNYAQNASKNPEQVTSIKRSEVLIEKVENKEINQLKGIIVSLQKGIEKSTEALANATDANREKLQEGNAKLLLKLAEAETKLAELEETEVE
jgi:hypothetical protein